MIFKVGHSNQVPQTDPQIFHLIAFFFLILCLTESVSEIYLVLSIHSKPSESQITKHPFILFQKKKKF